MIVPHWWETTPWRMVQTNLPEHEMADLDAGVFADSLADLGATVVNLNAAGIVASYDTRLDFQPKSAYLTGSSLRQILDACHARGIRVIARVDFARIRRDVYQRHPDWAARLADGSVLDYNGYVSVCPSSEYRTERMFEVLREVLTTHPFDGLYCNMSGAFLTDYDGGFYGVCQCDTCRARYRAETGREAPASRDPRDPALGDYIGFHMRANAAHKARLTAFVKKLNPELAVDGVDFYRSEAAAEYGRPNFVYKASSNARLGAGPERTRISDGAVVDYIGFRHRFLCISPALAALRQWQNLANSGCLSLYTIGRPDRHRDTSCFAPTRRVFQFHKRHQALFQSLRSAAQTVLLHTGNWQRADDEVLGWVRVLTESHVPFDELPLAQLNDPALFEGRRLVIVPDARRLSERAAALLDQFAAQGGVVLATGRTARDGAAAPACLGVKRVCEARTQLRASMLEIQPEERGQFPRCTATPYLDLGEEILCVEPCDRTQRFLKLIPEHPFGPPECCRTAPAQDVPGLLVTPFGSGRGVYLPWRAGALYQREGYANPLRFLQDVLFGVCGVPDIAPGLTPMVELTLSRSETAQVVQLVNATGCFANSFLDPVPVRDVRLVLPGVQGTAEALNGGTVRSRACGDALELTLDVLNEYEAIVITTSNEKGL